MCGTLWTLECSVEMSAFSGQGSRTMRPCWPVGIFQEGREEEVLIDADQDGQFKPRALPHQIKRVFVRPTRAPSSQLYIFPCSGGRRPRSGNPGDLYLGCPADPVGVR